MHPHNGLSVITCTLNSETYISQTLDSLVPFSDVVGEFIVVDGYSLDGTLRIVKNHDIYNIVKTEIFNLSPVGIANAMNFGASKARGRYLLFLNSDDVLNFSGKTLSLLNELFEDSRERIYLFNCDYLFNNYVHTKTINSNKLNFFHIFTKNRIFHPSTLISRIIFNDLNGYNEKYKYAFDYDFWLRASKLNIFSFFDLSLSTFRIHDQSLSFKNRYKSSCESFHIRLNHCPFYHLKIFAFFIFLSDLVRTILLDLKILFFKILKIHA